MVIAGKMMWDDIVNPNWIRASSSAVRPNMVPLFQHPRQLHPGSVLRRRRAALLGRRPRRRSVCSRSGPLLPRRTQSAKDSTSVVGGAHRELLKPPIYTGIAIELTPPTLRVRQTIVTT